MSKRLLPAATIIIASSALVAGCQSTPGNRSADILSQRWQGKTIQEFEGRFGPAISHGEAGTLVWKTVRKDVTPPHERAVGFGIGGVMIGSPMKSKVAAQSETKTCAIAVASSNETITRVSVLADASTRESASLCTLTYGQ